MGENTPFEQRLTVMRVRKNYCGPYRKSKYFNITKPLLKNKKDFLKYAKEIIKHWPTGTYYLKLSDGKVFARFDVEDGKIIKFYKDSPITGKKYPIWDYIKK